jgi:hypothetical protein
MSTTEYLGTQGVRNNDDGWGTKISSLLYYRYLKIINYCSVTIFSSDSYIFYGNKQKRQSKIFQRLQWLRVGQRQNNLFR